MSNHNTVPYRYSIHGIVSLESDIWLPEIAFFRVRSLREAPSVRVLSDTAHLIFKGDESVSAFTYHDGLGRYGFWIHLEVSETTIIQVSPILQRSPHVLYTNVIEPVLRWMFIARGYVLIHGACFGLNCGRNEVFLITARTDTGKTTTMLKLLDRDHRLTFLSDDLTLLAADRTVLSYPKPLTISRHTVASVRHARLSGSEKLFLPVQSRLHSRGGRRIAHFLSGTRLPMATINAVTQLAVPPPKYPVTRLAQGIQMSDRGRLAGVFEIKRATVERVLPVANSAEMVSVNTDDAFGFPPYNDLEPFLTVAFGTDLRSRERQVLAEALAGVSARCIESASMGWARQIAGYLELLSTTPFEGCSRS